MNIPGKIILQGIGGSHAYGMAREGSDIDTKGVYVTPMVELTSLSPPKDTVVQTNPDFELHEVGKLVRLALKCNPTVTELLWLDEYEILTDEAQMLIDIRTHFLSRPRVAGAYGGYAMDQMKRLMTRNDGSFSSDTRKRYSKHARHCFRLMMQGKQLLLTGTLSVKVADPDRLFEIGELEPEDLVKRFESEYADFQKAEEDSFLVDHAQFLTVDSILRKIRKANP